MLSFFFRARKKRNIEPLSDKGLHEIWFSLQNEFFPEEKYLLSYTVCFSGRKQKRVLGSCNITDKRVKIAKELNDEEFSMWLPPLLYHEMCHAVLGKNVPSKNGRKLWHGTTFKKIEMRHPLMHSFNVWVKSGGWLKAVRKAQGIASWNKRRKLRDSIRNFHCHK